MPAAGAGRKWAQKMSVWAMKATQDIQRLEEAVKQLQEYTHMSGPRVTPVKPIPKSKRKLPRTFRRP